MKKTDVTFSDIPDSPGVYKFSAPDKEVLYVGKATSLRDRVRSYFAGNLSEIRSPLITKVVADASHLTWEETDSVLDALILESKLIRELKPVGNTDLKDDKSHAYLAVTKEKFPRFLIFRERELELKAPPRSLLALYGPFLSVGQLREALKIIRRIFPLFDTAFKVDGNLTPAQKKTLGFNQSIGVYPKTLDEALYKKTVRNVRLLFDAKKTALVKNLERDMKRAAKDERFEEAEIMKRQLFTLKHIQDMTLIKEELRRPEATDVRIEAYDTAHTRGEEPRGVMAVIVNGEPVPSLYRIFTIRTAKAGDDYQALEEIIRRRARHHEWQYPTLMVIDGGRGHMARARKVMKEAGMESVELLSVVKDERHRPREILGPKTLAQIHESAILLANAEAHRFAIGKHRKALRKRFTEETKGSRRAV